MVLTFFYCFQNVDSGNQNADVVDHLVSQRLFEDENVFDKEPSESNGQSIEAMQVVEGELASQIFSFPFSTT